MSSESLTRETIVQALDDLGEREKIADLWIEDADRRYPPKAVRQRSRRLRWQVQWGWRTFALFMLLVAITGGFGSAGWTIPGVLFGVLLGFGGIIVVLVPFTGPWWAEQVRALQLYDFLKQMDGSFDSSNASEHENGWAPSTG